MTHEPNEWDRKLKDHVNSCQECQVYPIRFCATGGDLLERSIRENKERSPTGRTPSGPELQDIPRADGSLSLGERLWQRFGTTLHRRSDAPDDPNS